MGLTALEPLNNSYRKYEYETNNCFCDKSICEYLSEKEIFFHRTCKNAHVEIIIFATDDEMAGILNHINATAIQNLHAMTRLIEKKDFLSKYFDSVEFPDDGGNELICNVYYHKDHPDCGRIISVQIKPDHSGEITWSKISFCIMCTESQHSWNDIYYLLEKAFMIYENQNWQAMNNLPKNEISGMTDRISKNLSACRIEAEKMRKTNKEE